MLIDCPPNFNISVRNAITASNYYLIPAKLDYLSMLGIEQLTHNVSNYLKEYGGHTEILKRQNTTPMPIFLTLLGVVPMMVNILKDNKSIAVEEQYKAELKKQHYRIFQYVRNNSTLFGAKPEGGMPIVMTRPRFNLTAKRIVNELKELGEEFLSSIKIDEK